MTFDAFVSEYVTPAALALAEKIKNDEPLTEDEARIFLAYLEFKEC